MKFLFNFFGFFRYLVIVVFLLIVLLIALLFYGPSQSDFDGLADFGPVDVDVDFDVCEMIPTATSCETTTTHDGHPLAAPESLTAGTGTMTTREIAEFLSTAETVGTVAHDLLKQAQGINQTWDDGGSFSTALVSLRDLATRTEDFAEGVMDTVVPEGQGELWDRVRSAAGDMVIAANEMVTGLRAPDTGQIRRAALADFGDAVSGLTEAVETSKQAAG